MRIIEGAEIRFIKLTNRKFFGSVVYKVYGRDVACLDARENGG